MQNYCWSYHLLIPLNDFRKLKTRRERGQALIPVMIAIALISVFAMTILNSTSAVRQGMNTQFYKYDIDGLSHVLLGVLNNPYLCQKMLKFNTAAPYGISGSP